MAKIFVGISLVLIGVAAVPAFLIAFSIVVDPHLFGRRQVIVARVIFYGLLVALVIFAAYHVGDSVVA